MLQFKYLPILMLAASTTVGCNASSAEKGNPGSIPNTVSTNPQTKPQTMANSSVHQFTVKALDGKSDINFADFKGKKILIVNVASECGYTPQYKLLQELYDKYQDQLVIVGFPCNDFGGQEPGDADQIKSFCTKNYGVTFPLAEKVAIVGDKQAEIYQWLTHKDKNGKTDATVKWNFHKFLMDENGELIGAFPSNVTPLDEQITKHLKAK